MLTQTTPTPIAFSGNIPPNYDSLLGPMFFEHHAADMAKRIGKLKPKKVLELASGTGRLTKMLPNVIANDGSVIASDLNPAMVEFGKTKASDPKIEWKIVDAVSLPFEDNSFDLVVVQFGVMFYSDKVKAFKEAFRVLKPGGTFLFNSWDKISNNTIAEVANETLLHFFPIDTPAFYKIPFAYFDKREIESDLTAAGFKNPKIETVTLTGQSNSVADAANGLIKGTPTITAIEERDKEIVPELIAYLEKLIINKFGSGSIKFPTQAIVTEVKK